MTIVPAPDPERMTGRAMVYIVAAGLRNVCVGIACLTMPGSFRSSSFDQIKTLVPGGLFAWGVVTLIVGVTCLAAAATRKEGVARAGLLSSAVTTSLWAGGFFAAWHAGNLAGVTAPIMWTSVTIKDLVVCRQPMRSPFEPLVRQALARRTERRTSSGQPF